jgi:hypothetical protein
MGETSNQIERHIQETRRDLSDNFVELEDKVKTAVDWRAQFEERPGTLLAVAFGGGILLSALFPSRGPSRRRPSEATYRDLTPDRLATTPAPTARTSNAGGTSDGGETWDAIKGAMVGVATSKLSGFIEQLVPGFSQEFTRAKQGRSLDRRSPSGAVPESWKTSTPARAD